MNMKICVAMLCALLTGCSSSPRSAGAGKLPADQVGRPIVTGAQVQSLQSSVMALADTSMQRIAAEINLARAGTTPEARRDEMSTRLALSSSIVAIAMQPDPVDALADLLTFTTLTADAQRVAALGKAVDSYEARLLRALELNDADAWHVAQRWVNEPTRIAFRERMPFLVRLQAEVYTGNALATKEAQQTQAQATAAIDAQRKAILKDLLQVSDSATRTGSAWIGRTLMIGVVLIAFLLAGLLGTMLLYRRLLPRVTPAPRSALA